MRQRRDPRGPIERKLHQEAARVRIGSYEFIKKGVSRFDMRDPYYLAVALTWPQFLAALFAIYLLVNFVFGVLFWLVPGSVANAQPGNFLDAFFFSIETLATVGYGDMHPATPYGHFVVAIEIVCGLAFTAILTGLTFVRFSRPRAKLLFAPTPVVAMHKGKATLMLRVGNARANVLLDAMAKLNIVRLVEAADGKLFRRAQEVRLERSHLPVFPFTWTLMHVLDERSPLYDFDAVRAIAAQARVFLMFQARDPTLGTVVHDIRDYAPEDIRFGTRYANMMTTAEDGTLVADMTKIGALEPDRGERVEEGWTEREEVGD